MNIFYWLHNYTPQALAFNLGVLNIYWYGIIMALAILLGVLLAVRIARFRNVEAKKIIDLATGAIIGGIVGARIYEIFLEFDYYSNSHLEILKIWHGGLAIHGAIIGAVLVLIPAIRYLKYNLEDILAIFAPALALGQAIGRFGNWFNQELYGAPTNLAFGIPIDIAHRSFSYINYNYFHPTFLYESLGLLVLAAFLYYLATRQQCACRLIIGIYLIGAGLLRFVLEFIKIDETIIIYGVRWPQIFSLLMIIGGLIIIFYKKRRLSY